MKYFLTLTLLAFFTFGCGGTQDDKKSVNEASNADTKFLSIRRAPSTTDLLSIAQKLRLDFSAPLDDTTVNDSTVYLLKLGELDEPSSFVGAHTGITTSLSSVYLTPYEYLKPSTSYQLVVTKELKDIEGHSLKNEYVYSFTTDAESIDSSSFGLRSTKPKNAATAIIANVDIVADFNATLSAEPEYTYNNFFKVTATDVNGTDTDIEGKVEVFNSLLKFLPNQALPSDSNITVELTNSVRNIYGIESSGTGTTWSFQTRSKESMVQTQGFKDLKSLTTSKHSYAMVKYGESVIVAQLGSIDLYTIGYEKNLPFIEKVGSYEFSDTVTSMIMNAAYVLVATNNNGISVLKYDATGNLTLVGNYLSGQAVYGLNFAEFSTDRVYATGPQYGLEIIDFNSTNGQFTFTQITTDTVGEALDVVEVKSYDDAAQEDVKKIYVADYKGGVVILDINGTFISRTDLNASIKKLTFNEDYNGKTSLLAIDSSGVVHGVGFDGAVYSNVITNLPGTPHSVFAYMEPEGYGSSNLYYSTYENGIVKTSGDYISTIISTNGRVISSTYINAYYDSELSTYITAGFLLALNDDGELGIYNEQSDLNGPEISDIMQADTIDANMTIYMTDRYFDVDAISSDKFTLYDLNTSSYITTTFSREVQNQFITITLDPDQNLTSGDTYRVTVLSTFSDMLMNPFNDGVDYVYDFLVE